MKLPLSKTLKKDISSTNEPGERRRWDDKIASCFEIHSKQRFRSIEKEVNEGILSKGKFCNSGEQQRMIGAYEGFE